MPQTQAPCVAQAWDIAQGSSCPPIYKEAYTSKGHNAIPMLIEKIIYGHGVSTSCLRLRGIPFREDTLPSKWNCSHCAAHTLLSVLKAWPHEHARRNVPPSVVR